MAKKSPSVNPSPIRDIVEGDPTEGTPQSAEWTDAREEPAHEPKGTPLTRENPNKGRAIESARGSHK